MPDPRRYPRQIVPGPPEEPTTYPARLISPAGAERKAPPTIKPPEPTPPLSWLPINEVMDLLRGATGLGEQGPAGPTWANAGALAAALPIGTSAPRGFFSRIDELLGKIGSKGVHPNKLLSLLRSGASQEEVAFRKLPELIASKGNTPITAAELKGWLGEHPAPMPTALTLGASSDPAHVYAASDVLGYGSPEEAPAALEALQQAYPHATGEELRNALYAAQHPAYPAGPTRYGSYTLPGGENYRETLLTLPTPMKKQGRYKVEIRDAEGAVDWQSPDVAGTDVERLRQQYAPGGPYAAGGRTVHFEEVATPDKSAAYQSGHFDQPNIVAHVRTKERTLAAPPPTPPLIRPDLAKEGWTVRVDVEDPYSGRRQMTLLDPNGEWQGSRGMTSLTPEEYLQEHAVERGIQDYNEQRAVPTGEPGRFIEEIQSDWHQAGKKQGYRDPVESSRDLHNAGAALKQAEIAHQERLRQIVGGDNLTEGDILFLSQLGEPGDTVDQMLNRLPERYAWHPSLPEQRIPEFSERARAWFERQPQHSPVSAAWNAMNQLTRTRKDIDEAQDAFRVVRNLQSRQVPDAPFKESWPDLALKQQLLETAEDPKASWLGFTTGKSQGARYDLSHHVSKLEYDPNGGYLYGYAHDDPSRQIINRRVDIDELADYLGKEPAAAIHKQIAEQQAAREWERSQWSVEREPDSEWFNIFDSNGEMVYGHGGDPERFRTENNARYYIDDLLKDSSADTELPSLSGLDLQVGGQGMRTFYDEILPARLRKLLKPFGGTVEPGQISTVPSGAIPQGNPKLEQVAAWVARLTPEMKARILKEGFPLMLLPLAVQQALLSSEDGQVGAPPPVPAPPSTRVGPPQ